MLGEKAVKVLYTVIFGAKEVCLNRNNHKKLSDFNYD